MTPKVCLTIPYHTRQAKMMGMGVLAQPWGAEAGRGTLFQGAVLFTSVHVPKSKANEAKTKTRRIKQLAIDDTL